MLWGGSGEWGGSGDAPEWGVGSPQGMLGWGWGGGDGWGWGSCIARMQEHI